MAYKIIQWNIRGIKSNLNELLLLIGNLCPTVICLQETFLKEKDITIRNFTSYDYVNNNTDRALGSTSILIHNKIPQSRIQLDTNLQAAAASATLHRTITIWSIYIPSHNQIIDTELDQLLQQLPRPFILIDDFNSHNIIWRCKEINKKGKILEKIINENNLCLLNIGMQTYINPFSRNTSAIDLTICDPSIYMDFSWQVYDDTCGSNHFPILLINIKPTGEKILRWKLDKANWEKFKETCKEKPTHKEPNNDTIEYFTETLNSIAIDCIPRNATPNKQNIPWFNNKCQEAIR